MNRKGFSYLEVLISMALLSIIILPIISGFSQAQKTIAYSVYTYTGNLLVSNMMVEVESVIEEHRNFDEKFTKMHKENIVHNLEAFLQTQNFEEYYQLDKYDYSVFISTLEGEVINMATKPLESKLTSTVTSSNRYIFQNNNNVFRHDFYITIDNDFNENTIDIDLRNFYNDIYIKIDVTNISNVKNVNLIGENKRIFLNIKIEENKDLLNINWNKNYNIVFKRYYSSQRQLTDYLLTVAIYNKNETIIKSISKLISS